MTALHKGEGTQVRAVLSSLWVAVLLSQLFRDMHEFLRDGFIEELAIQGTVYGGTQVSGTTLVIAAVGLQLLVAMVVLAWLLPRRANRAANMATAAVMMLFVVGTGPKDGDDLAYAAFQLVGLVAIVAMSIRWRERRSPKLDAGGVHT